MDSEFFYERQRGGDRAYRVRLIFWTVLFVYAVLLAVLFPPASGFRGAWLYDLLDFAIPVICIAAFFITRHRFVSNRRALYERYEHIPYLEKQRLNAELAQKFKGLLFGEKRFYFYFRSYLHFINYKDVVWAYQKNIYKPLMIHKDGEIRTTSSSILAQSLILYDADGRRYKLKTKRNSAAVLNRIRAAAPKALIGYTRERKRLLKRDLANFRTKGKNI